MAQRCVFNQKWLVRFRDGYRLFFPPNIGAKPVLLKRYRRLNRYLEKNEHKTTIDNDDIKNLFGQIPCKSRSHGALTKNGYQTVVLVACSS